MARPRRSLLLLAAAAAIATGGCAAATAGTRPVASRPAASGPSASGSSAPTVTAWARSAAAALDLGGGATATLEAVVAPSEPGGDWVVAGTRRTGAGTTVATVWTSTDTVHWRATALPGRDGRALAATAWGSRTVVVGSIRPAGTTEAAVWTTSGPGQPFSLAPSSAALLATPEVGPAGGRPATGTASMDVVAAGTQGVFAAGSVSGRQAVWYSTDGTAWVRLRGAEQVIDASPGAQVTSLLVTPDDVLAAGTVRSGTLTDGAVWTSADGISWRDTTGSDTSFAGGGDHRIDGLAAGTNDALFAVGAVRAGPTWTPASWVSPDATSWSQPSEALPSATPPQPGAGGGVVRAVAANPAGTGLVAVGGTSTSQSVWTSTDGLDWQSSPLPAADADSSTWSADLVATTGATTIVADAEPGQPALLVQRAGRWHAVASGTFGAPAAVATPAALVDDAGTLVLAVDVDRPAADVTGAPTATVEVLGSPDGIHWRVLAAGGALAGGHVDALAVVGGTLVAAGSAPGPGGAPAAAVWTSATGRSWQEAAAFAGSSGAPGAATTVASDAGQTVVAGTGTGDGAVGRDAPGAALSWSSTGDGWQADGTLDGSVTEVDAEEPLGSCSRDGVTVVVGTGARRGVPQTSGKHAASHAATAVATGSPSGPDGQGNDGTSALAWRSTATTPWTPATVTPLSGTGGTEAMDGCAAVGTGFVAWGTTPGAGGAAVPALWTSTDGAGWALDTTTTLSVPGSAPLTSVDPAGSIWLAVSGGQPAATAVPDDPTATVDDPVLPAAAPAATTVPSGSAGVWVSGDGGRVWARVVTTGTAWSSPGELATDLVGRLGTTAVVVGQVDGQLAVWTGTLT